MPAKTRAHVVDVPPPVPVQEAPAWLMTQLRSIDQEGERYTRVAIEVGAKRSRLAEVARVRIRDGEEPAEVLARVDRMARANRDKFVRVSLYRSGETVPDDSCLWTFDDEFEPEHERDDDEPAALKSGASALLRQAYQQNQFLFDRTMQLHQATLAHVVDENASLRAAREDVHNQHRQLMEAMNEMEREQIEAEKKVARDAAIYGSIDKLVSAAAVRIGGMGDGPLKEAVEKFFNSMDDEQQAKLMSILTPDQLQIISALIDLSEPKPDEDDAED